MPSFYSAMQRTTKEPQRRFYPTQDSDTANRPTIPSAPTPPMMPQQRQIPPERRNTPPGRVGEMPYFEGRYPILLQRLYDASGAILDTYSTNDFPYDAYPDYLSLRLMRDRLLRESRDLTEEFLQAGCPIMWLELLTDTILSEQLCRRRREKVNR